MIIGHSIGGMIARMALLLNNHPHCIVKDIIQLSAPNTKAPYVPDASLDTLYHSMNKAWVASYQNQSTESPISICKYAMKKHISVYTSDMFVSNINAYISNDFYCPRCVDNVRVVSITGGEIDIHVRPDLTNLHNVFKPIRGYDQLKNKETNTTENTLESKLNHTNDSNRTTTISYIYGIGRSSIHCLLSPMSCILKLFSFGKNIYIYHTMN